MNGWIGVDLDGTLAKYDTWDGPLHIGEPVPAMVERVKQWLAEGKDVRIFTARVCQKDFAIEYAIRKWCLEHLGQELPVTNAKDYGMVVLYDDRAVGVVPNQGTLLTQPESTPWLLAAVQRYVEANARWNSAVDSRVVELVETAADELDSAHTALLDLAYQIYLAKEPVQG